MRAWIAVLLFCFAANAAVASTESERYQQMHSDCFYVVLGVPLLTLLVVTTVKPRNLPIFSLAMVGESWGD